MALALPCLFRTTLNMAAQDVGVKRMSGRTVSCSTLINGCAMSCPVEAPASQTSTAEQIEVLGFKLKLCVVKSCELMILCLIDLNPLQSKASRAKVTAMQARLASLASGQSKASDVPGVTC